MAYGILLTAISLSTLLQVAKAACKTAPNDPAWPSSAAWSSLNATISGKLIHNVPVAAPCYAGPYQDTAKCAVVQTSWNDSNFQAQYPTGYDFPYKFSCDIVPGNTSACAIGDSPVYAINVTSPSDVVAGINFARMHNLRLAIKQTGHDFLGRSTGTGSLEIWTKHLQQGLVFQSTYKPSLTCSALETGGASHWAGSAVTVGGAYTWSEVYPFAHSNGVIVVGGTCLSVGAIGGYIQGGGHSAAAHQFGIATDQVLEFTVVLANGSIVLASPCSNPDLYQALRGGGGGTYGVVVSATLRAHPEVPITAAVMAITPTVPSNEAGDNLDAFLDAVTAWYQNTPSLYAAGLSGSAGWSAWNGVPLLAPHIRQLEMAVGGFNQTTAQVQAGMSTMQTALEPFQDRGVNTTVSYYTFPDYYTYYMTIHANHMDVGGGIQITSRFLGASHLANSTGLRDAVATTAGAPGENAFNVVGLNAGGAVATTPPLSGVNPAWRRSILINIAAQNWASTTSYANVEAYRHTVTYVKGKALERLAPDTGSYMNEGNYLDPDYLINFYGDALPVLAAAKKKYDPTSLFYCKTCVGSEEWAESTDGHLCLA